MPIVSNPGGSASVGRCHEAEVPIDHSHPVGGLAARSAGCFSLPWGPVRYPTGPLSPVNRRPPIARQSMLRQQTPSSSSRLLAGRYGRRISVPSFFVGGVAGRNPERRAFGSWDWRLIEPVTGGFGVFVDMASDPRMMQSSFSATIHGTQGFAKPRVWYRDREWRRARKAPTGCSWD